jgi:surfeit locus 1 family protein
MIIFNRRFAPSWKMTILTLAGITLFSSLGFWQLERAIFKDGIMKKFEARLEADYRQFEAWESLSDIEFQKIIIGGHYDTGRTLLIDNQLHRGQAGYHVITPFILNGGDKIVLVNRGWVALGNSREQLPGIEKPVVDGSIRGIANTPDTGSFRMGEISLGDKWPQVIPFLDIEAMQAQYNNRLLPIIIWLEPEQAGHYQRVWNPVWLSPDKSRAYAWQWFAFAAISLGLFIGLNRRSAPSMRQ